MATSLSHQEKTKRMTLSAMMLALATALALICAWLPFLNLPFGGGFTIASMLPLVLVAYLYGTRWGLFTAFLYSLIQLFLGTVTGGGYILSLFTVGSEDFMGVGAGIAIVLIDYLGAYTLLGFGGVFRKRCSATKALVLGTVFALSLRYLAHIVSGAIFFGTWAEWFFSQEGFYKIGEWVLSRMSGTTLAVFYSVFYNGLYMLPEIVITSVCAAIVSRIPIIRPVDLDAKP